MKRRTLSLLAAAGAIALLAAVAQASAPFVPRTVYHIAGVQVTRSWRYSYSGGGNGSRFSSHGGETMTLSGSPINSAADGFGIYTARLSGAFRGRFFYSAPGTNVSCPDYKFDPAAVQEQLQLNLLSLSGGRVEVGAGIGPGQTSAATAALQRELAQVGTTCGRMPVNAGYALTYSPAPNNVHTQDCSGIADGCQILPASAFSAPQVQLHIDVSNMAIPSGFTVIPPGAHGHDRFSWKITVVLRRA